MNPTFIANIRAPYFVNPPTTPIDLRFQDLFAELISRMTLGGVNVLDVTDQTINANVTPYPAFACTRWAIRMYWYTANPPPLTGTDRLGAHSACPNDPGSWVNPYESGAIFARKTQLRTFSRRLVVVSLSFV
jgi:hypothetical protein